MNSPGDEGSVSPHGKIGFSPAFLKLTDASHQLGFKVACLDRPAQDKVVSSKCAIELN